MRLSDLIQRSEELFEQMGEIKSIEKIIPQNQLRGSFIMIGENKNIKIFFTLTPEKNPLIQYIEMSIAEKSN